MLESKVEANSLSDITQIASNPPKYPRNPTESRRPPLTLYIARVPGSKDIILTTLKPLLKNVTAEDVAASLYFLHLNTADDARLLEAATLQSEANSPVEKALPRKPLPESAKSSLDIKRLSVPSSNDFIAGLPKRKPVATGSDIPPQSPLTERRPLVPRSLLSESSVTRKPLPGFENRPLLRQQETSGMPRDSVESTRTGAQSHNSKSTKAFSITVIRRDPSSGAQWNVGMIGGHATDGIVPGRTKKPYFDMSIQLSNPGYNRFSAKQSSIPAATEVSSASREEGAHEPFSSSGFERTLRMGTRPTVQHSRSRSDIPTKAEPSRFSSESPSQMSALMMDSLRSSAQSHPTGYTFLSPWQGQCQFFTSVSGRSLKCKHNLPAPISADASSMSTSAAIVTELRFNLPSAMFNPSPSPESKKRRGMESRRFSIPKFGELREKLNAHKKRPENSAPLDNSAMRLGDEEQRPYLPPRLNLASFQRKSHDIRRGRPQSPESHSGLSDDEDDSSRLDLSMGREKAGGGNRGKRAKLGKLIIHDEGFKMMDLVVATNMAVWWSVWEGS